MKLDFSNRRTAIGIFLLLGATILSGIGAWEGFSRLRRDSADVAKRRELAEKLLTFVPSIGERSLGATNAPVVVIEYASATCPHCAQFHIKTWPQIRASYIDTGKVRWIFREFPLDSLAMAAFMLARCADPQKYFAIIDLLFRQQKLWMEDDARKELSALMQQAGMDRTSFESCLNRRDLAEAIYDIAKTANSEFSVNSTPTFFVNGLQVHGAQTFDDFIKILADQSAE